MPVHNLKIAEKFSKIADFLEIKNENNFKIRAYRKAARIIKENSKSIVKMIEDNEDLTELNGIGDDLANQIKNIVKSGKSEKLEKLKKELPEKLTDLLKINGLGPKKVRKLYDELNIENMQDLKDALDNGKVVKLDGFGKKTRENISKEIGRVEESKKRIKLSLAKEISKPLLKYMKKLNNIDNVKIAGSYRRKKETVGDLDILVTCEDNEKIMEHFTNYGEIEDVISKGETKSSVLLKSGLQIDLRVVAKESYGSALHYFTGSKDHNVKIRSIAQDKGLKVNEYGIFKDDKKIGGEKEVDIYEKLYLKFIEPELRENRGEIEASKEDNLPTLIKLEDIKGDLHVHTKETDGNDPMKDMIEKAIKKKYEYIAITDHSKNNTVADGMGADRLEEQIDLINKMNDKYSDIKILKGIEVDILKDGSLDLPDKILKELDVVIGAVHSYFDLSENEQTKRVINAMENKYFNIFAHPTGRLINERGAYDINIGKILEAANKNNVIIELNGHPDRLDLNDTYLKMAKNKNVKIAINTDAHSTSNLDFIEYGINQARRGWLEKNDVINTLSLKKLLKVLKK